MKKIIIYILVLLPLLCFGQLPTDQNYARSLIYRDSTQVSDESKAVVEVLYFDGLGRPKQKISGKTSSLGTDVITLIKYDSLGRPVREFLPYVSTGTNQVFEADADALTHVDQFYNNPAFENTSNPYTEKFYENSPLGRIKKQAAPGTAWKGNASNDNDHAVKYAYAINKTNEVKKLSATATWDGTNKIYDINLVSNGFYGAGQLNKTISKNENLAGSVYTGAVLSLKVDNTEEFKDKDGKIILKRSYTSTPTEDKNVFIYTTFDTYYVYDQFNNLTYVLPPLANGALVEELCYQYKYDDQNRLVEKKVPGKQWEFIVYDKMNRIVSSGPAFTPFGGLETGWMETRYDNFGRIAYTGWLAATPINSTTRKAKQDLIVSFVNRTLTPFTIDGVGVNYDTFPTGIKMLAVNYYDNYTFPNAPTSFASIESQPILNNTTRMPKGLATGSWVRTLQTGATMGETSYILYDLKGRVVSSRVTNYLGGYTQTNGKLNFEGTIRFTTQKHKRLNSDTNEIVTQEDFTYTPQNRLLSRTHKIGSLSPQLMSYNTYNSIGQLIQKKTGGTDITGLSALQSVDYTYNIRGWLKGINDISSLGGDLFAYKINFDTVEESVNGNVKALYNGNIAETFWRTSNDNVTRKYGYSYDNQNRLTAAYYQKRGQSVPITNSYNESVKYDVNGNILNLIRNGGQDNASLVVEIDNLAYTYAAGTNQLTKVIDNSGNTSGFKDSTNNTGDDFTYDANGNLLTDKNKGITNITYNHLNLPVQITFNNSANTKIIYLYNARGVKLKKIVTDGTDTGTDYLGGYQYKNGVLQFLPTVEGYVKATTSGTVYDYNYVFSYRDHLGNVRLNYTANGRNIAILEEDNYYPFGLKHSGYNNTIYNVNSGTIVGIVSPFNKYTYIGKELQDEHGYNMYDLGARNYDPALGRWMNIDPLASKYFSYSPYEYAFNSPVYFMDFNGMEPVSAYTPVGPGENKTEDPIVPAGKLKELVIEFTRAKPADTKSSIRFGDFIPDINLGYAFFGRDLYKSYDKVYSTEDGRQFMQNLHKNDEKEARIYAEILVSFIVPGALQIVGELGSLALVGEEVAILDVAGEEAIVTVVETEETVVATKAAAEELPTEIHHFATNKHSVYTKQMEAIAKKYGLKLDEAWNKAAMPHRGRHPHAYHEFVLEKMEQASLKAGTDKEKFLQLFDETVKQPVLENPSLLRKSGW